MDGNKRDVLLLIGSILIVLIACMGTISADDSDNYDDIILIVFVHEMLSSEDIVFIQPPSEPGDGYYWSSEKELVINATGEYAFAADVPDGITVSVILDESDVDNYSISEQGVDSAGVILDGSGVIIHKINGYPGLDLKNIEIVVDDPEYFGAAITECNNIEDAFISVISEANVQGISILNGNMVDTTIIIESMSSALGIGVTGVDSIISGVTFIVTSLDGNAFGFYDFNGIISDGTFTVTSTNSLALGIDIDYGEILGGTFTVMSQEGSAVGVMVVYGTVSGATFWSVGAEEAFGLYEIESLDLLAADTIINVWGPDEERTLAIASPKLENGEFIPHYTFTFDGEQYTRGATKYTVDGAVLFEIYESEGPEPGTIICDDNGCNLGKDEVFIFEWNPTITCNIDGCTLDGGEDPIFGTFTYSLIDGFTIISIEFEGILTCTLENGCIDGDGEPVTVRFDVTLDEGHFRGKCDNNGCVTDPAPSYYTITVSGKKGAITVPTDGTWDVAPGAEFVISFDSRPGYDLDCIQVNGGLCSPSPQRYIKVTDVNRDYVIEAFGKLRENQILVDFSCEPCEGTVPLDVTCTYESPIEDIEEIVEPDEFDWDFGNGKRGEGRTATTTYTMPGHYTVTLTGMSGENSDLSGTVTRIGYIFVEPKME